MKIAFVTSGSLDAHDDFIDGNLSGTESQVNGVARHLGKSGHQVRIYKISSRDCLSSFGRLSIEEVNSLKFPRSSITDIATKVVFGTICRRRLTDFDPDVINITMKYSASRVVKSEYPTVHFAFNNPVRITPGRSRSSRILTGHMESIIAKKADALVARNARNKSYWEENSNSKVQIIPVGVSPSDYPLYKPENFIFYGGRFSSEKRILDLISAYSSLPEKTKIKFDLVLCGEGPLENNIVAAANSETVGNIEVLPWQPQERFAELLAKSKIFVLPSEFEGMPVTLIEALITGTPTIASDIPGNNDIISNNVGRLFKTGDTKKLRDLIEEILNNPKTYENMRKYAVDLANSRYTFESIASQYEQLYQSIL